MSKHLHQDPAAEREANDIGRQFMHSSNVVGDMSRTYGTDLSSVRLHTDSSAAQMTAQRGVDAFSTGKDIFFGQGVFNQNDPASRGLLAHELSHSMQQGLGGRRLHAAVRPDGRGAGRFSGFLPKAVWHQGFNDHMMQNFFRELSGRAVNVSTGENGDELGQVSTGYRSMDEMMEVFNNHNEETTLRVLKPLWELTVKDFTDKYPIHKMDAEQRRSIWPQMEHELQSMIGLKQWGDIRGQEAPLLRPTKWKLKTLTIS